MTNTRAPHEVPQDDTRSDLPMSEEARSADLHERQVSYVQASLLRGISYDRTGESAPDAARR